MGIEVVTVGAGGGPYTAMEEITVRAAFNEAARSFWFRVAAELGGAATNAIFATGTEITISANGDLLLTGYVDNREPEIGPREAFVDVSGRSKSQDLIDGAAEHETGYFENQDPLQIGQAVSSEYEPKWETDQQLEKIDQYLITQGETCFRCVEKLARQQGMTITGTAEGNAKITKAGSKRQGGQIVEGRTLKKGKGHHSAANRHSKIVVRGQRPFGHGDDNVQIEATEQDSAVQRHRTVIIIQDEDTTKDRAQKRAKNRKNRAAGNALKATITMQGFHDETGQLWEPGNLVWTESQFLGITQDMLIEAVEYTQNADGSIAKLSLVDPRAYDGQGAGGGQGNQSSSEWNFG